MHGIGTFSTWLRRHCCSVHLLQGLYFTDLKRKLCCAESAEEEQPQGFFESGGALKSLTEKFPPEPEEQPSADDSAKFEEAGSEGLPPPAPTADSEADTDEQSVTPAVQGLRAG